ncbi:MAG: hypothetical protein HY608_08115 [Planctomycetes bacterium]|nr:hypothetical protein [Planctomycetota bacterium]
MRHDVLVLAALGGGILLAGSLRAGDPLVPPAPPAPAPAAQEYTPEGIGRTLGLTFAKVESAHFVVHSSAGQATAAAVSARLEAAYGAFCEALGIPDGTSFIEGRLEALLLANKAQYDRLIDLRLADPRGAPGAEWEQVVRVASGFRLGPYKIAHHGSGPPAAFRELCAHMMAHAMLEEYLKHAGCPLTRESRFPFWLHEGLAAYVDRRVSGSAGTYCIAYGSRESTANPWRDESHRWEGLIRDGVRARREGALPDLRKVQQTPQTSFDHPMRAIAWSMVGFLVAEDDARERGKFRAFLEAMARADAVDASLDGIYGIRDVEAMDDKWRRWARRQGGSGGGE